MKPRSDAAALYREIAALTAPACAGCARPHSCCTPRGCELAAAHTRATEGAAAPGGEHATLRYMGPHGCLLRPEQRPACATWCCAMRTDAGRRANPELRRQYQALRARIRAAERS